MGALYDQYKAEVDAGHRDAQDLDVAAMIDRDRDSWERELRADAESKGVPYDPSDLQGVIRNTSYAGDPNDPNRVDNRGVDPRRFVDAQKQRYTLGAMTGNTDAEGGLMHIEDGQRVQYDPVTNRPSGSNPYIKSLSGTPFNIEGQAGGYGPGVPLVAPSGGTPIDPATGLMSTQSLKQSYPQSLQQMIVSALLQRRTRGVPKG